MSHIENLLKVIASQGLGGKDKEKCFSKYKDKMIMNSKHNMLANIPKANTLESLLEWQYNYKWF